MISGTRELPARAAKNSEVIAILSGRDATACAPVVERTRRAVRVAAASHREERLQSRRNLGVTLAATAVLLTLLGPLLWSGVDDLFSGEHFADLHTQAALLVFLTLAAALGALAAGWRSHHVSPDVTPTLSSERRRILR
jgi:hypothetical protein